MNRVVLSPYDPTWKFQDEKEIERVYQVFQEIPLTVHHIGSTSIPTCQSKPILDLLGIVSDVTDVDHDAQLAKLGYRPVGEFGMRRRRFFIKEAAPAVNLHIFEDTDPEVDRHLPVSKLSPHPS